MPDLSVPNLVAEGGIKPMATGSFAMPEDALLFIEPFISQLIEGKKKIIIKSKPYKVSGSDLLLVTRNKAIGIIRVSAPKQINVKRPARG